MEMNQIYELVNTSVGEVIGETGLLTEDMSKLVDVGTAIFNANAFDHYVRSLVNQVGRMVFVNRSYRGSAPSVLMDSWEFGSVLMKVKSNLVEATVNEAWELEDGASYNQDVFYKPDASAKFFNKRVTFEVDRSITERQVKESFQNAGQMNAFISMLFNEIEKSLTVSMDNLVMRTINNMIGETINDGNVVRAVNLLGMYNNRYGAELQPENAITTPEFVRYAAYIMGLYQDRMARMSTLFNIGGQPRFTPNDMLHKVVLSEFAAAADVFLQSGTYHEQYTKLVNAERVPYWQGTGTGYNFKDTSRIDINIASTPNIRIEQDGILAVMFDRDALGVTHYESRVNTHRNEKAEFTNYFYKKEAAYFNDTDENFVVFYVA